MTQSTHAAVSAVDLFCGAGGLNQSFPKDYQFVAPGSALSFAIVGRLIGNAVPPLLGELVGVTLMSSCDRG